MTGSNVEATYEAGAHITKGDILRAPRRRATLVNLRFQLGPSRFRAFRKMIAAIENGDWPEAAKELRDSNLARQTPGRTLRRADELEQG